MRRTCRSPRRYLPVTLCVLILLGVLTATSAPSGQERRTEGPRPLTPADYARAERFLAPSGEPAGHRRPGVGELAARRPFWYRYQVPDGYEFILVDPAARTRRPAFDHARLAATLSAAAKGTYTAHDAPLPVDHVLGRHEVGVVRPERPAVALRRARHPLRGSAPQKARSPRLRRRAARAGAARARRRPVARRRRVGVHSRLESLGPRRRDRPGAPAHHATA